MNPLIILGLAGVMLGAAGLLLIVLRTKARPDLPGRRIMGPVEIEEFVRRGQAAQQAVNDAIAKQAAADALAPSPPTLLVAYDQYFVGLRPCCQLEAGSPDFVHVKPENRHTHIQRYARFSDGIELRTAIGPLDA